MKERPIIMSGESVRAILAGTKTQTRRVVSDATSQGNYRASELLLDDPRVFVDCGPSPVLDRIEERETTECREILRLRQRVEELERAPRCCADTIPPGCRTCRCADAAEAKLARCVEALGEIRGRSLAAKTHEVGPLEAQGRLTRILELACAALAVAKGGE